MATSQCLLLASLALVLFIGSASAGGGSYTCPAGFKDCDPHKPGCETCVASDVNNCGACGAKCKHVRYATAKCEGGSCKYTCDAGWSNCDGNWATGCEADTRSDAKNCGGCRKPCAHVRNAVSKCAGGKCAQPVCDAGWANCDGNWATGCETDTRSDAKNCGGCRKPCAHVRNAVSKCAGGKCATPVCDAGWANCDGNWATGCEKNVQSDVINCGKCGNKCPCTLKGGEPTCSAGKCGQKCKSGTKYNEGKKCCVPY